jgi:DNA-binding winged helix-turn-helix (wHTH) protein
MFRFSPFELDLRRYQLRLHGSVVPIQRRPFDLLHYLVERPDVVVSKEELLASVWRGVAVTEDSLARAIMAVRVALGDDVGHPQFIHTVRGRGYRFARRVDVVEPSPSSSREPSVDCAPCPAVLRRAPPDLPCRSVLHSDDRMRRWSLVSATCSPVALRHQP